MTGIVAAIVIADPESYPLTHFFVLKHHLDLSAFNWSAGIRLALLMAVFLAGYCAIGPALHAHASELPRDVDPETAVRLIWRVNLVFLAVTAAWFVVTAVHTGGIGAFLRLIKQDAYSAREILLENKLFTGMRLFYAALPATGCLAAGLLAAGPALGLSRRAQNTCIAVVLMNLVVLLVLPLVMSQRLILLQYVLSTYATACIVQRRLVAIILIPVAIALFLLTWVVHEALTNPEVHRSATDIAGAKLSFYIVNDLWNSFRPLNGTTTHTFGLFSLQFAMFFSLSDAFFYDFMTDQLIAVDPLRGGGEFSLFSASYVDFGLIGGAVYLAIVGGMVRFSFHRATESLAWAAIYGQCAVALVLSVHVNFFASQDFVFAIMVIAAILIRAQNTVPEVWGRDA